MAPAVARRKEDDGVFLFLSISLLQLVEFGVYDARNAEPNESLDPGLILGEALNDAKLDDDAKIREVDMEWPLLSIE